MTIICRYIFTQFWLKQHFAITICVNFVICICCISSKSRRGEILFQSSVWCGDNLRAARFWGWRLQRSTCTRVYTPLIIHVSLFVSTCNARVHTYTAGNPLPCGEISRVVFIGMSMQKHVVRFRGQQDFEVRRDFKEIWYAEMIQGRLNLMFYTSIIIAHVG